MQTIASMADRLDMNSEEAIATLRKLDFDIKDVNTPLSDDQCDILIDVDEDPTAIDEYLNKIKVEEEEEQKKEAKKKAAAKKAAATRKAAAKKKAAVKKKPAAKKKTTAKKKAAAKKVTEDISKVADTEPAAVLDTAPEVIVEILPDEPDIIKETAAPETFAEILPDDAEPFAKPEQEEKNLETENITSKKGIDSAEINDEITEDDSSLPQPDPDVVAEVIRKANERARQKQQKTASRADKPALSFTEQQPVGVGTAGSGKNAKKTGKTARKKQKRKERVRLQDESLRRKDAAAAIREFESGSAFGTAPKKRRKKRLKETDEEYLESEDIVVGGVVELEESMTLEQIAGAMEISVNDLILELMEENIMATKNQILDIEIIRKLASKFNFEVQTVIPEEEEIMKEEPDNPEDLLLRPPVITVMGHVDHGKTSFLDVVRSANVADGEAGGITQHIAAYDVSLPSGSITFLDTPGHEAFTQMRSRGAQVTDVVVLVVAADDGIKPQTVEAINHAKAAEVPIVVAVNKCDKPGAKPEQVRQELTAHDLVAEEWGGKTQMVNISAKTRDGIDDLLELLALESEMLELKANPNKSARGTIIESEISKGQGPVAWVLVQSGTLKVGDIFLAGETYGRVRTMTNSYGKNLEEAGPSMPVVVTGFNKPADAGDQFITVAEDKIARSIADKRANLKKQRMGVTNKHMTLEDFHSRMLAGEQKTLNVILKADVQGSVDVLISSCSKVGNAEVSLNIVHSGVGGVNESDVILASASDAVIIAFQVTANPKVQKVAEQEGVEIRTYRVIYEAIDELSNALEGLLTPDSKEVISGHAEIRQVFRSSAHGSIAGSYQLDGVTERGAMMRLLRDDVLIYQGIIETVRREKDDVKSVATGYECGIKIEKYNDIQEGDIIETYKIETVAKKFD